MMKFVLQDTDNGRIVETKEGDTISIDELSDNLDLSIVRVNKDKDRLKIKLTL